MEVCATTDPEGGMAEGRVDGLLESLGATFDAALAREEEAAATDLAMSLRQDRSLLDLLHRGSWRAVLEPGLSPHIAAVGHDVVVAEEPGRHLIPTARLQITPAPELDKAERVGASLIEMLRDLARASLPVLVPSEGGSQEGVLRWVGTDHLALEGRHGVVVVALTTVRRVSVLGGEDL
jgi:hypothetical protein